MFLIVEVRCQRKRSRAFCKCSFSSACVYLPSPRPPCLRKLALKLATLLDGRKMSQANPFWCMPCWSGHVIYSQQRPAEAHRGREVHECSYQLCGVEGKMAHEARAAVGIKQLLAVSS